MYASPTLTANLINHLRHGARWGCTCLHGMLRTMGAEITPLRVWTMVVLRNAGVCSRKGWLVCIQWAGLSFKSL